MGQTNDADGPYAAVITGERADKIGNSAQGSRTLSPLVNSLMHYLRFFRRAKITVYDFEPLKIIGRGAFGEVRVCRNKKMDEIVAIKKMKKNEMIYKN